MSVSYLSSILLLKWGTWKSFCYSRNLLNIKHTQGSNLLLFFRNKHRGKLNVLMCSQLAYSLRTILNTVMKFLLLIEDRIHNDKLLSIYLLKVAKLQGWVNTTNKITHYPMNVINMNLKILKTISYMSVDLSLRKFQVKINLEHECSFIWLICLLKGLGLRH